MNDDDEVQFDVGTRVMISRASGPKNELLATEETGTVLGIGFEYLPSETSSPCHDGILVKLQISNNRGIFAPSDVSLLSSSPPAPQRRSKRLRVTPSPTLVVSTEDRSSQPSDLVDHGQKRSSEDAEVDADADTEVKKERNTKKAKHVNSSSKDALSFRVQASTSSSKCRHCKRLIPKKHLRIQPTSSKHGWYHVVCARDSLNPCNARDMEDFMALSESEQQLLTRMLLEDDMMQASDTDSDDLKDMPYRVEYSSTGRATCRGCDERIAKGLLRVAERPLFRGKPGFTVYRHLQCTIFPQEIARLQDIGGWRRIKKSDRQTVMDRIEESNLLVEKENQELQPDELVQVNFQGEIRPPPKGLAASLLPFQVEGVSWMVHQELHVPEIRGGILADEMVRCLDSKNYLYEVKYIDLNYFSLFRVWERRFRPLQQFLTIVRSFSGPNQELSIPHRRQI